MHSLHGWHVYQFWSGSFTCGRSYRVDTILSTEGWTDKRTSWNLLELRLARGYNYTCIIYNAIAGVTSSCSSLGNEADGVKSKAHALV